MFLASLAGMLGRRTGHGLALCLHTFGRPVFVMLLLCFCLFGYLVATKGQGKQLEGMNIKEYKMEDYSKFLAWVARNGTGWDKAKKCLEKAEICAGLFAHEVKEFYNLKMTPLQSGCCKPPFACGYALSWGIFTNPTNDKADKDCDLWGHGFATRYLCFDCNSCRAGMAETIKARLLKMTSTNLGLSCGFVFTLLVECYLIRRERKKMEVEMEEAAHKELKEEEEEWDAIMWQGNEGQEDEYEYATSHSNYQQTQPGMQYNMYQPTIPYPAQSLYYQQGQYGYPYGY